MDQYRENEMEHMVDDFYDVLIDHPDIEFLHDDDSDFDDSFDLGKSPTDTTAAQARNGRDIQGIPWERLSFSRDKYRETRLKQYRNYENLLRPRDNLVCLNVEKGKHFYDFQFNTRIVKSTIVHFQKRPGVISQSLSRVQISTMAVKDKLMVAGGFKGELIFKYLDRPEVAFCSKISTDENSITNSVDLFETHKGSLRIMAANNDAQVRVFDAETFVCLNQFPFEWSVNSTSATPDAKLMAVLGDSTECLIAEAHTGKAIGVLTGHLDYSFASAWHPDGRILATGNQDTTCRLWDIRNLSKSLAVLKGNMGAIRSVKFTTDGRFLAIAEPADFVHCFDTHSSYTKSQEIDIFGEIAGISFSPDTESLFVGVADRTYGSLLEFNRRHHYSYMDAIF